MEKASEVDHGCQVKCTGLYADVWYSEEDTKLPDKIDGGNTMLLNMLKDGGKNNVYFTIVTISLSVVNNIPMNQDDKLARLSYILESNIAKTSLESKHRQELAYQMKKWPLYCPQGSGTLRQQLLMMHGIAWYCMVLHCIA